MSQQVKRQGDKARKTAFLSFPSQAVTSFPIQGRGFISRIVASEWVVRWASRGTSASTSPCWRPASAIPPTASASPPSAYASTATVLSRLSAGPSWIWYAASCCAASFSPVRPPGRRKELIVFFFCWIFRIGVSVGILFWNPLQCRNQGFGSGSAWIRINLSCWIRIRIQIADPDPDPGGQNDPQK